eukprot:CAMPEP_0201594658 /NCGR_PEP_ID=MMETSP0190_2-20130828/191908_1 /ASSEMBLY_ACC=CAM_ASM_000263 /TAXON_ID=37353 /ORGANISM="Rosalina sp." /LENGTH=321 /DNA_ID=CAMNT_0048054357 /DNA_START=199 /DNA_END=1161 /DNA_ORIENTATION=+
MSDSSDDEYKDQEPNNDGDSDEAEEIVFAGQISRAPTQVTGLTNIEKSKTLMTLSTAKVQTKPTGHSNAGPYVPSSDLFQFTSPQRPEDDLKIAKNQTYAGQPIAGQPISNPTFARPTAARQHGNVIQQRYAQHLTFRGDNNTSITFGKFKSKSSCCMLVCSTILSLLFCYVAIVFFPKFGEASCEQTCAYAQIPEGQIRGIMRKEVTLISACQVNNYLMISFDEQAMNMSGNTFDDELTFEELGEMESDDVRYMYIGGTDFKNPGEIECWNDINPGGIGNETMNGVVFIDASEYTWDWPASGWYLILSIIMALFFILIEW